MNEIFVKVFIFILVLILLIVQYSNTASLSGKS